MSNEAMTFSIGGLLSDTPCSKCGEFELVSTGLWPPGAYVCSNCGDRVILSPSAKLHIYDSREEQDE
jgi:hypothetical protein